MRRNCFRVSNSAATVTGSNRFTTAVHINDRGVNILMSGKVEIAGFQAFAHVADGGFTQQHGTQHGLLGLHVLRQPVTVGCVIVRRRVLVGCRIALRVKIGHAAPHMRSWMRRQLSSLIAYSSRMTLAGTPMGVKPRRFK